VTHTVRRSVPAECLREHKTAHTLSSLYLSVSRVPQPVPACAQRDTKERGWARDLHRAPACRDAPQARHRRSQHSPGRAAQGFYTVYSAIFATLAEQEAAAARARGGGRAAPDAPAFGASGAAADDVLAFYAHWQAFGTAKDFAWADQYNPAAAPNRKARAPPGPPHCAPHCVPGPGTRDAVSAGVVARRAHCS
jgi:hypothetical protein